MAENDAQAEENGAQAQKGGKSKKILIIVLAAIVVLGGAGAGAYFFVLKDGLGGKAETEEAGDTDAHGSDSDGGGASDHGAPEEDGHGKTDSHGKDDGHGGDEGGGSARSELTVLPGRIEVNLRDMPRGGVMFEVFIEASSIEAKKKLEKKKYPIRDALLMLSSSKTRAEFDTIEGLELVKREIKERVEEVVGAGTVAYVGFSSKVFFGG